MRHLLFLVCMTLFYTGYTQTIYIKDNETNSPLEAVYLIRKTPYSVMQTNAAGEADLTLFANAEQIEIRCIGYQTTILSYADLAKFDFKLSMKPALIQFDEVVVSATRWNQSSNRVPSKITTLLPKEVALYNPQTAADMLGATGEVFIQKSQQGGGSPMIRGFATNRLLYAIDGIRMNSAIFRAGNIQQVISLDPFAVEHTEVFFGSGSILYGSDAIGGVMSFQTLTPSFSVNDKVLTSGKAVGRYSSANSEQTYHADFNVGWKKWAMLTSVSHASFGDLMMGQYGPDTYRKTFYVDRVDNTDRTVENTNPRLQKPSGYSQFNLMQKVRFSPSRMWDIQAGFHYSETSNYSRYDRLIETQTNGLPMYAVWNYGPQIWQMANLSATHNHTNTLYNRMALRIAHQYFEESRIDRRYASTRLRTNLEKVNAFSINADFEKRVEKHQFFYGVEYVMNKVNSYGSAVNILTNSPIAVADRYPASTWKSYAAYLNYQFIPSEKILIQSGARINRFEVDSDFTRNLAFFPFNYTEASVQRTAVTGSLGLVYTPDTTWKLTVNGGTGFRAPNVDDMGKMFDFVSGEVIVPNPSLKAEYAYQIDATVMKRLSDAVQVEATGFYTYLQDAMVRRTFQSNGQDFILYNGVNSRVYAIQNAAHATVLGLNAGITIKLSPEYTLSSRYNVQRGREEMDNGQTSPSRHAAPAFGLTRLTYQKEKFTWQLYAQYSAQVSNDKLNPEEQGKPFIYAQDNDGKPYAPVGTPSI